MTEAADSSAVSRREAVAMIGTAAGAMLAPTAAVHGEPSSHIWMWRLPGDLEPGTHRAHVRVTDEYGRELQDRVLIEVVGASTTAPRRT
jgi:hypothetical protein